MEWWQELLVALAGGTAAGSLLAPYVNWGVEKRRLKYQTRAKVLDDFDAAIHVLTGHPEKRSSETPELARVRRFLTEEERVGIANQNRVTFLMQARDRLRKKWKFD